MKFPGGDRLRRIRRALFPTEAMPAEVEARQRAREAAVNELRHGCANRLRPYIGQLILVTNFKEVWPEENAARIRDAVLTPANFGTERPIGISAILSSGRDPKNHEQLIETASALKDSFASSIGDRALLLRPQSESSSFWLLSLARAAEDTARQTNLPPEEVGCIAVVSALDMYRQANTYGIPEPGTAFKMTHISEDARFGWQTISVQPPAPNNFQ